MKIEKKNYFIEQEIKIIEDGINSSNRNKYNWDVLPFMVLAKKKNEIIGGAQCGSVWDWMHIKLIWVDEKFTRKGLGRKLISEIETEAKKRSCIGVHVDTFEFQAIGFYNKLGYQVFGEIENHPIGQRRFFLKKILT